MNSATDEELLRQISAISGAISQHKAVAGGPNGHTQTWSWPVSQPNVSSFHSFRGHSHPRGRGQHRGGGGAAGYRIPPHRVHQEFSHTKYNAYVPQTSLASNAVKDIPRAGLGVFPPNRSDNEVSTAKTAMPATVFGGALGQTLHTPNVSVATGGFITKRSGKNMQLINKDVLSTAAAEHAKKIRTAESDKNRKKALLLALKKERQTRTALAIANKRCINVNGTDYTKSVNGRSLKVVQPGEGIRIKGLNFVMDETGRKLVPDPTKNQNEPMVDSRQNNYTPKKLTISGNVFLRTKKGNLVQASGRSPRSSRKKTPCEFYMRFGTCKKGHLCPYLHDSKNVALCRRNLKTGGGCTDPKCLFSHDLIPEKVPLCSFFAKGSCTKAECPYLHSKVSSDADVCRKFALENYCEKGASCPDRHVAECPDFAKSGNCPKGDKCKLAHPQVNKRNTTDLRADDLDIGRRRTNDVVSGDDDDAASDSDESSSGSSDSGDEEEEEGDYLSLAAAPSSDGARMITTIDDDEGDEDSSSLDSSSSDESSSSDPETESGSEDQDNDYDEKHVVDVGDGVDVDVGGALRAASSNVVDDQDQDQDFYEDAEDVTDMDVDSDSCTDS